MIIFLVLHLLKDKRVNLCVINNDIVNNVIILLKLTLIYFGIKYAKLSSLIYIEKNLSLIILNFFFWGISETL